MTFARITMALGILYVTGVLKLLICDLCLKTLCLKSSDLFLNTCDHDIVLSIVEHFILLACFN